jgi:hypothetical protein
MKLKQLRVIIGMMVILNKIMINLRYTIGIWEVKPLA